MASFLHTIVRITNPGRPLLRASFQGYNDESDLERLLTALKELFRRPLR
jgi:selenocysteine lyase/cysteine desulfurase